MSDDLAQQVTKAVARVRAKPVATIPDAALILDRSVNRTYGDARNGAVAGIPVIRVSAKSIRIPSRPLLRLVGLDDERTADEA